MLDPKNIPTDSDWGDVHKDYDLLCAYQGFKGISFDDARMKFQGNAIFWQEKLQYMPMKPLEFYLGALIAYLLSDDAKGDADGASTFLNRVEALLKTLSDSTRLKVSIKKNLFEASKKIAERQAFYNANEEIYGKFQDRINNLNKYFK